MLDWTASSLFKIYTCAYAFCAADAAILALSPQNVTTVVRSSVTFRCKTDTAMRIRWNRIVPDQLLPIVIYNGYSVSRRLVFKYSVRANVSAGLTDLHVEDVGLLDAGTYACHQMNSSVTKAVFYLFVTGEKKCLCLLRHISVKC